MESRARDTIWHFAYLGTPLSYHGQACLWPTKAPQRTIVKALTQKKETRVVHVCSGNAALYIGSRRNCEFALYCRCIYELSGNAGVEIHAFQSAFEHANGFHFL